jgi:hypothetical protein
MPENNMFLMKHRSFHPANRDAGDHCGRIERLLLHIMEGVVRVPVQKYSNHDSR